MCCVPSSGTHAEFGVPVYVLHCNGDCLLRRGGMTEMGQKRRGAFVRFRGKPAVSSKAYGRESATSRPMQCSKIPLLNHLVGKTKRVCRPLSPRLRQLT